MSNVKGAYVKFWLFLPCPLTTLVVKLQTSKIFYFVLVVLLILGKVKKIVVEKFSTSEVISQNPHRG